MPGLGLMAGLAQHPLADIDNQARVVGDRDKTFGQNHVAGLVAEGTVDAQETIEIDIQQRAAGRLAQRLAFGNALSDAGAKVIVIGLVSRPAETAMKVK